MPDLACLQAFGTGGLSSTKVFEMVAGSLLFALAASAIVSHIVRFRYRAWVARLMALDTVLPRPAAWWQSTRGRDGGGAADVRPLPGSAAAPEIRAAQVERRLTRATLVAWAAFSLCAAAFAGVLGQSQTIAMRLAYAAVAALLATGPALANLPPRWSRRALGLGTLALAAGGTLGTALEHDGSDSWAEILGGAAALALIYVAMLHRSLRGQVLPLFVVSAVAMVVIFVPLTWLEMRVGNCLSAAGDAGASTTVLGVAFAMLALPALWVGFRVLDGLLWLRDRGWFSDVSLPSFAALGVAALAWLVGAPAFESGSVTATVASLPLLWLVVTAVAYAAALGPRPPAAAAPQLLMLRVFAQRIRQHALLDHIQQRWRCVGPVHQIGGPDLAGLNVDLDECSMYLSGQLHELFVPEEASAEHLRSRLGTRADREGRFRINEVFCFNTAWRSTVAQLMSLSDAVVLDLRGFTAHRRGTAYEIGLIGHADLLARVVAVGDIYTNWRDVESLLREAGADPAQLARFDEAHGADALFERLLAVAAR